MSSIIEQKALADFQADRDRMEFLMEQRKEQKWVLERVVASDNNHKEGAFVKSMGGSFFFMNKSQVEKVVKTEMKKDEKELKEICARVEKITGRN
mmetsp:Transcript_30789/g.43711  ORF Transcript_30789/g.43711 Transcript_30789/m.43711 type:complete len:95 (-) Transcript_30789:30-314(-)